MAARKKSNPEINTSTEEVKAWKPGLFDFIEAVGNSKRNLIAEDPEWEKEYNPYMVNQAFSLGFDTIFYANEMNISSAMKRMQHDFYLHLLPAKKRFSAWPKKLKPNEDVAALARYLGCSVKAASRMIEFVTETEMQEVRDGTIAGGR